MEEKKWEETIDEIFAEAAKMADEEQNEIDTVNTDDKEIVFSKEHERRMKKIFAMAEDYERVQKNIEREIEKIDERANKRHSKMTKLEEKTKQKEIEKALTDKIKTDGNTSRFNFNKKNLAITCTAVLIIGVLMIPTVGAWRKGLVQILFKPSEEYSEFNNVKDNENTAEVDGIRFCYVPRGFAFEEAKENSTTKIMMFVNEGKDLYFDFKILNPSRDIKINTESGEIEDISTLERDMILVKNDKEMYITWQDAKNIYVLGGNCDEKTLKEIAEKIEIVQK